MFFSQNGPFTLNVAFTQNTSPLVAASVLFPTNRASNSPLGANSGTAASYSIVTTVVAFASSSFVFLSIGHFVGCEGSVSSARIVSHKDKVSVYKGTSWYKICTSITDVVGMESAITFPLRINFAVPPVLTGSGFNATEMSSMSFPSLSQVSHLNDFIPSRDVAVESRTGEDEEEEEEAEKIKAEYTSKRRSTRFDFANELVIVLVVFIRRKLLILSGEM
jgi:hypothetical protein